MSRAKLLWEEVMEEHYTMNPHEEETSFSKHKQEGGTQ